MIQLEFELPATLHHEVRLFWILDEPQMDFNSDVILPDSHTELVINVGAPLDLITADGVRTRIPDAFLNRVQQKPLRLYALGAPQFIAVRLYPWMARAFIDPLADLAGSSIVPLSALWQQVAKTIRGVFHHFGYAEAVACLTQILVDAPRLQGDLTPIQMAGEQLYAARGQVRIGDLAAQYHLSVSQFERRFKYLTGVSVKTYARLIRFEAIRAHLFMYPRSRIADMVQDFGFTDQAHFIHEFKSLTAWTPGAFAAEIQARYAEIGSITLRGGQRILC